jgi:hypothetical protein
LFFDENDPNMHVSVDDFYLPIDSEAYWRSLETTHNIILFNGVDSFIQRIRVYPGWYANGQGTVRLNIPRSTLAVRTNSGY